MNTGEHVRELGELNVLRLIFKYSTPTIVSTIVNAAYNVVDRIFVGRACGEDALAAVTVCFSPMLLFLAVGMAIGHGSATMVSIMLGEKKRDIAERYLGQAFFLFVLFSAILAVFILPNIADFLCFFGATEKILPLAEDYYSIIIAGIIFEKLSFGISNLIRAEGRPIFSMTIILSCGFINAVLDYIFLFCLNWGVEGAALATVVAQAFGTALVLYFYFFSKRNFLHFKLRNFRVSWNLGKSMFAAGSPSFVIQSLAAMSTAVFILQAKTFGAEGAIAVIGVSTSVTMFLFLPVVGLSMGAQPIFGYNWGADNFSRVKETLFKLLIFATSICVLSFAVAQLAAKWIYILFLGANSSLIPMGESALRILTAMLGFIGVNIVASGYFQATKRPKFSIFITTLRQLIFLVPLMILLPEYMGLDGVWLSFPISDFAAFVLTAIFIKLEMAKLDNHIKSRDI